MTDAIDKNRTSRSGSCRTLHLLIAVAIASLSGCDSTDPVSTAEPPSRSDKVVVSIWTNGVPHDIEYVLRVSGEAERTVAAKGFTEYEALEPGTYSLELVGIHDACSADAENATEVTVNGVDTIHLTLMVTCPTWKVFLDQAHANTHRIGRSYKAFAELLEDDGYSVEALVSQFTADVLADIDILVISNALDRRNVGNWSNPVHPAFETDEVEVVRQWVSDGGRLLLIADHMPFPAAAAELAAAFGLEFNNGFAFDSLQIVQPKTCLQQDEVHVFRRSDGTLADHAITRGRADSERVDSVASFTGQAFEANGDAASIMLFNGSSISIMPARAWDFSELAPRVRVDGWSQGAVLRYGAGRAAFFGEAAMFTKQTCDGNVPMGFQAKPAAQNGRFIRNLFHWYSGLLD